MCVYLCRIQFNARNFSNRARLEFISSVQPPTQPYDPTSQGWHIQSLRSSAPWPWEGTGNRWHWWSWVLLGRGRLLWLAWAATSPDILHSPRTETLQLVSLAWLFLLVIPPGITASQLLPYLFIWALRKTYQTWTFCWFCDRGLWPDRLNSLDPKGLVVSAPCLLMISLMPSVSGIQWLTADAWYLSSLGILSKDRRAWGCDLASFGPLLLSVSESSSPTEPLTSPSKQQLRCCCLPPPAFLMPFCQRWHLSR